jgi:hypothetical protein
MCCRVLRRALPSYHPMQPLHVCGTQCMSDRWGKGREWTSSSHITVFVYACMYACMQEPAWC